MQQSQREVEVSQGSAMKMQKFQGKVRVDTSFVTFDQTINDALNAKTSHGEDLVHSGAFQMT